MDSHHRADTRSVRRHNVRWRVDYHRLHSSKVHKPHGYQTLSFNISKGGIGILLPSGDAAQAGDMCALSLCVPEMKEPFLVIGRICWRKSANEQYNLVGIKWLLWESENPQVVIEKVDQEAQDSEEDIQSEERRSRGHYFPKADGMHLISLDKLEVGMVLARDLHSLGRSLILPKKTAISQEHLEKMRQYQGSRCPSAIYVSDNPADDEQTQLPNLPKTDGDGRQIPVEELKVGMVLARDIHSSGGTVLFPIHTVVSNEEHLKQIRFFIGESNSVHTGVYISNPID